MTAATDAESGGHEEQNLLRIQTSWDGVSFLHSPVHQALLFYQPLRFLSGHTAVEPRLRLVDGYKQTHKRQQRETRRSPASGQPSPLMWTYRKVSRQSSSWAGCTSGLLSSASRTRTKSSRKTTKYQLSLLKDSGFCGFEHHLC